MSTAIAKNFQIGADGTATNNFTIFQPASPDGTLRIGNGNTGITTGLVTLTSAGNLGLGVTPSAWTIRPLQILRASFVGTNDASSVVHNAYYDGSWRYIASGLQASLCDQVTGIHRWFTAPSGTAGNAISWTQAMTLDASGNLGVGTTSPTNRFNVKGASGSGEARLDGNSFGAIYTSNGDIQLYTNNSAYTVRFLTATGAAESARFDNSGNLLVGTTGGSYHTFLKNQQDWASATINTNSTAPQGHLIRYTGASPNNTGSNFLLGLDGGNTTRFSFPSNGGLYNYQANNVNLSDRREKTNFAPAGEYLSKICAIPVQTFNYIDQSEDDPGLTLGVVAQDVQAVAPELVTESNWGTAEEPKMRLSIYQTDLQYALMKCIQEQQAIINQINAKVEAQAAEIAALKGQA